MKALNLLRNLIFLLTFLAAASSVSAAEGTEKPRKASTNGSRAGAAERTVKAPRKEVAAFVDPTAPLAELVERVRTEQAR